MFKILRQADQHFSEENTRVILQFKIKNKKLDVLNVFCNLLLNVFNAFDDSMFFQEIAQQPKYF